MRSSSTLLLSGEFLILSGPTTEQILIKVQLNGSVVTDCVGHLSVNLLYTCLRLWTRDNKPTELWLSVSYKDHDPGST